MGTNYYLKRETKPPCECCGRSYETEDVHIGKSSGGWCFALHIIPDDGIHDLPDWEREWSAPGVWIEDEYGDRITPERMKSVITKRFNSKPLNWLPIQFAQNHAEPGPNNLVRHRIEPRFCTGHGAGTWDLVPCDFS